MVAFIIIPSDLCITIVKIIIYCLDEREQNKYGTVLHGTSRKIRTVQRQKKLHRLA
jgi:hypothetical protein